MGVGCGGRNSALNMITVPAGSGRRGVVGPMTQEVTRWRPRERLQAGDMGVRRAAQRGRRGSGLGFAVERIGRAAWDAGRGSIGSRGGVRGRVAALRLEFRSAGRPLA